MRARRPVWRILWEICGLESLHWTRAVGDPLARPQGERWTAPGSASSHSNAFISVVSVLILRDRNDISVPHKGMKKR